MAMAEARSNWRPCAPWRESGVRLSRRIRQQGPGVREQRLRAGLFRLVDAAGGGRRVAWHGRKREARRTPGLTAIDSRLVHGHLLPAAGGPGGLPAPLSPSRHAVHCWGNRQTRMSREITSAARIPKNATIASRDFPSSKLSAADPMPHPTRLPLAQRTGLSPRGRGNRW